MCSSDLVRVPVPPSSKAKLTTWLTGQVALHGTYRAVGLANGISERTISSAARNIHGLEPVTGGYAVMYKKRFQAEAQLKQKSVTILAREYEIPISTAYSWLKSIKGKPNG